MTQDEAREAAIAWFDGEVRGAFLADFERMCLSGAIDTSNITFLELRALLLITAERYCYSRSSQQVGTINNLRCFI